MMTNRLQLIKEIEHYEPVNEQEASDRAFILDALLSQQNIFQRENGVMHMTASEWVLNRDDSRILMAYHNIYKSWAWLGGHADGEEDLRAVALREVREESGIRNVCLRDPGIFSLEVLTVDGHEKKGSYVSSHLHLNVTFLITADDREQLRIRPGENSSVAWFDPDEAVARSTEPWFQERIYGKLNRKLRTMGIIRQQGAVPSVYENDSH